MGERIDLVVVAAVREQQHRVLAAVLEAAVNDGKLSCNPARTVKTPKVQRTETAAPDPSDVERIAAAVPQQHATLVRLLALAGLRFGEASA